MALTDKNIVITPNIGQTADPKIVFSGADASTGAQNITVQVYPTNNGTLSFEGSNGQLFSINNNFTGTIFSVNDISGIPSIEVLDTGEVRLAQYSGFVHIPNTTQATSTVTGAFQVDGGVGIGGNTYIGGNLTVIGLITGNVSLSGTITTASNIALGTAGQLIYQTAAGLTGFAGPGTAGQILLSNGTSGPVYTNTASIYVNSSVYAEEIRGGTVGQLLFQSAANTTNYAGPGTAGQLLVSQGANAAGPVFTNTASIYVNSSVYAEDLRGGVAGAVAYQSGPNVTAFTGAGTTGQILTSGGTGSPTWNNTLNLAGTTAASSTSTGALVVAGGAGIGGNLYVGGTLYGTVSGNITTATNIAGGTAGAIHYQIAAGQTGFIGIGTNGYVLKSNGTTATWVDPATMVSGIANTATNIAGGAANQIPYQSGVGLTTFSSNFTYNGTNLTVSNGLITANSFVPASSAVPTNGMYLPAANTLGFATASGGNRIYITSGGLVGINTNGPGVTLDVNGDIRSNSILYVTGTGNATGSANSTGALRVSGGAAVASDLWAGGNAFASNNINQNARVSTSEKYPTGHFAGGETVFEIDPTWSQVQLQTYFNSTAVSWVADSTAPGGYSIQVDGGLQVGGFSDAGFPYIPIDSNDIYYMECWIKNDATYAGAGHYMGSTEYNESFGDIGGNPGSYGYWVMSNSPVSTAWTKVSGYISGFGTATGQFRAGAKYWTPQALFNYSYTGGTRRCFISGWKIIRVGQAGNRTFLDNITVNGTATEPRIFLARESVAGGISWYSTGFTAWCEYMASAGQANQGPTRNITAPSGTFVTTYARRSFIENVGGYGWTFESGASTTTTPAVKAEIRSSDGRIWNAGDIYSAGNIYSSYSDINLKTILGKIENPLDIVRSIETFYYEPNELALKLGAQPGLQVGVSAQSVQKKMPMVVGESPINKEYLTVQYERLVPVLLESVKALEDLVKAQEERIKQLEEKLNGTLPR